MSRPTRRRIVVGVGQEHLIEPSPGVVKEEAAEEALTLSDFDADIGKGAAADLSNGTFYANTEELITGLSRLTE